MGLISAPIRGLLKVFEEIASRAEDEMYNEDGVKAELMELYKRLEAGAITEEDFTLQEGELVQRLEDIEEHKRAKAGHGPH